MYRIILSLILITMLLSFSASHAQSITLNFQEAPLQTQVCSYLSPQNIQTAYNFAPLYNNSINGNGQSIAIVVAYGDPNLQNDINTFDSYYGLPSLVNGSNLFVEKPFGNPSSSQLNWTDETALDVEVAHSLAPKAKIYLIIAPNDSWLFQAVNYTLENVQADTVSLSWGSSELSYSQQEITYINQILTQGQSKGINIFAASGDSGAYNSYNTPNVNFPASSPNVIGVGGTTLSVYSNGQYKSEIAWNNSGGGKSQFFKRPSFQPDISSYRIVPDVAFNAGTPICIYADSTWGGFYGTSVAAPSWAAIDSLLNQNIGEDEGYLDKNLYNVYNNLGSLVFNNITSGCNGVYCADGKYNAVTGLGSPKVYQLVEALSNSSYEIYFNDPTKGVFSINGKNYSESTLVKFTFGEKINLKAYSNNKNLSEKSIFTSFSGLITTNNSEVYFFVNRSGTINVDFSRYLRVTEYYYNGVANRSYYVQNDSIFKISAQKTENYSGYEEVLRGFNINNGTIIPKTTYDITVLSPLNISFSWFNDTKVSFYFINGLPKLKANVSYYPNVPLSNSVEKSFATVYNHSYLYASHNSSFYVYGTPQIINGNRYVILNSSNKFSRYVYINLIKEYNYTINFISKQGSHVRPSYFYLKFNNISEKYNDYYIWAPLNENVTISNISYENVKLNVSVMFNTDAQKQLNVTLPVSDISIKVVTILGIPVVGAKVTLNMNNASFINSTNIFGGTTFSNVPQEMYNITITAYNSKYVFRNLNLISNTLSITAGLYEIYIIIGVLMIILIVLLLFERVRHKKHK